MDEVTKRHIKTLIRYRILQTEANMKATTECREVYHEEVHSPEGVYWFFSKGKRFLSLAKQRKYRLEFTIGNDVYLISSIQSLVEARDKALQHKLPVVCRVTFLK